MEDSRNFLPAGTKLELENGSVYRICAEPIGYGGGSIIYPAEKLVMVNGQLSPDGISYALKECYPASLGYSFLRTECGQVQPVDGDKGQRYLRAAKSAQLREAKISREIYRSASRMIPVRENAEQLIITFPGREPSIVRNTVTVMDSAAEKGRALGTCIKEQRRFSPANAFRIIQQLLFALKEVHDAGYLHLDIQSGNVFLRGTMEDKSELVTLIDFGSARAMTNGKTEPVKDRVIFTTEGFSAPEILLHNDGTLQLGP